MNDGDIAMVLRDCILVMLKLAGPPLMVALAVGLLIAVALIAGVALSAGGLWTVMAIVLLLPMILGSAYLCIRFWRTPKREWTIDLRQLTRLR